jgi:hypothetical protein
MRLLALLGLAGALFAQPDAKAAAEWIVSPEPLKQAWAAHWIAEQQLTAFIPDLLHVLESPETSEDADAARFAALDTLIQLNAEVPLGDLEPLADRFPTDVLILAARLGDDANALLLKLLDHPHNREAFIAVGHLLTPQRVPGFMKPAMRTFCQRAKIAVYNPDSRNRSGGAWAGDAFRLPDPQRAGWPDTGSYRLVENMPAGSLPAERPHAVAFVRKVSKSYIDHGFDYSSEDSGDNSCLLAEQFLAIYLDTSPSQLPIRSEAQLELPSGRAWNQELARPPYRLSPPWAAPPLPWTTEEAFETSVRGFIAEQRSRYAVVAGQLASRGYLTPDEASQVRLNLFISVADDRVHDRTQLPDIGEWAQEPLN